MTATSGLYIEIDIQADIDLVWRLTQDPASHQRFTVDWFKMAPEQVPSAILPKRLEARV